jgi:hypothetical protein
MLSIEVTLNSLRYARRLAVGKSQAPPPGWREEIRTLFGRAVVADEDPSLRWGRFIQKTFGDLEASRYAVLETWKKEGGELGFGRAVIRARTTLEDAEGGD